MSLLGSREAETTVATITDRETMEVHPHGLRVAEEAITDTAPTVAMELRPELPHGSNKLLRPLLAASQPMDTVLMAAMLLRCPAWELLQVRLQVWVCRRRLRVCHLCIMALEVLPRLPRVKGPHLRYVFPFLQNKLD